jgi:hypothetical protein
MLKRFSLFLLLLCTPGRPQESTPLPELQTFLSEIRSRLRTDRILLSQYTYVQKDTERELDKKGQVKKTIERVYEVYPSLEEELTYMRLISKDGKPVSAQELEKQDRERDKKLNELAREGADARAHRKQKESDERKKEDRLVDEVFQLYDVSLDGRENLDGRPSIRLAFRPRANYRPKSREAEILMKMAGVAWFDENDREIVRVKVELVDTVSFGFGVLARLNKGATAMLERRRVNDEIWLPADARFAGSARIMLFKGLRIDAMTEFSNYRKFSVETSTSPPTTPK